MNKGAKFSECGKYRYQLWRIWDESKPLVQLIGLNPSTANADNDDSTIRRISSLVAHNGYGGFYMTNLFGWISPSPDDLLSVADAQKDNTKWLFDTTKHVKNIVFCWGNFKQAVKTANAISSVMACGQPLCFGKNKNGSPKHPLYLKSNTKLIPF